MLAEGWGGVVVGLLPGPVAAGRHLLLVGVDQVQALRTGTNPNGFVGVQVGMLREVSRSLQFSALLPELCQTTSSVNIRND